MSGRGYRRGEEIEVKPRVYYEQFHARLAFKRYLAALPDAGVARVYKECLGAGRRAGANLAAIEAGRRLTKRHDAGLAKFFDTTIARAVIGEEIVRKPRTATTPNEIEQLKRRRLRDVKRKRTKRLQAREDRRAPGGVGHGTVEGVV